MGLIYYLESTLGIHVKPEQVVLVPGAGEIYGWEFKPEKRHLFDKQLSKHNLGACRELCREVGKSFHAVFNEQSTSYQKSSGQRLIAQPMETSLQDALDALARQQLELEQNKVMMAELKQTHTNLEARNSELFDLLQDIHARSWTLQEYIDKAIYKLNRPSGSII